MITDMKRGSKNIVKAYKNNEVIFERGEYYIRLPYSSESDYEYGFIHIYDKELLYNYKFVVDWATSNLPANGPNTLIGGSYSKNSSNNRYYGFFIGTEYYSSAVGRNGESLRFDSWLRSAAPICYEGSSQRHITTFAYDGEAQDPSTRTSGGFGLFAAKDFETDSFININERSKPFVSFSESENKVYKISIYDSLDNLLMNFIPRIKNGHKGVLDTVSGTFYPCSDDSKFEIEREA